jgi:hypothetical protein
MQVQDDILRISSDNLTDSIYDIKNAFEESSICRVRKIFAACCNDDPAEHALTSEPNKKVFYIWVEWTNTNASHMFTARLTHQGAHPLFKLDRRWGQPIVTERDEYGNPSEHAHWVVRYSSRFLVQEDEMYYLGLRSNEEVWQTYLADGETEEDTDDEEEDENDDKKDDEQEPEDDEEPEEPEDDEEPEEPEEPLLHLETPLQIPELKHNSPIPVPTPEPAKPLSIFMPVIEEQPSVEENDAFFRENFNIVETDNDAGCENTNKLTKFQLEQLCRGEYIYNENFDTNFESDLTITFPDGPTFDISK